MALGWRDSGRCPAPAGLLPHLCSEGAGTPRGPCSCRCLGIRLGLPRGGSFRKRRWVPDCPRQSEPRLGPAAPPPVTLGPRSLPWSPDVLGQERSRLGAGSGVSPALAPPLPPPGRAHAAALSLVLALGRLAGRGPPRDAAFHLQRLRPAFVLIGVLTVLHVLWGLGSRKSWPQPSGIRDRQSFQSPCAGVNQPCMLRALTPPSPDFLIYEMAIAARACFPQVECGGANCSACVWAWNTQGR